MPFKLALHKLLKICFVWCSETFLKKFFLQLLSWFHTSVSIQNSPPLPLPCPALFTREELFHLRGLFNSPCFSVHSSWVLGVQKFHPRIPIHMPAIVGRLPPKEPRSVSAQLPHNYKPGPHPRISKGQIQCIHYSGLTAFNFNSTWLHPFVHCFQSTILQAPVFLCETSPVPGFTSTIISCLFP